MNEAIGAEGGKGIFIKEIEDALLSGAIDLAVHSMKDVPTEIPVGLGFAAVTRREDPRDCLISREGLALEKLPQGARVGTSSLRRQAQLRDHPPDLDVVDLRGNVDTRIRKLDKRGIRCDRSRDGGRHAPRCEREGDANFRRGSHAAGSRAGRARNRNARGRRADLARFVAALDDEESRACVTAERALLRELQGGCQVPLGAWGRMRKGELHLEAAGLFRDPAPNPCVPTKPARPPKPQAIGIRLAQILIDAGADKILRLAGRSVGSS